MVQVSLLSSSSVLHMRQKVSPRYRHLSDRIYENTSHKIASFHKNHMILPQKLNCLCLYGYGFLAVHLDISGALLAKVDHWTPYPVFLNLLVKICQYYLKKESAIWSPAPKQDTTKKWMTPISDYTDRFSRALCSVVWQMPGYTSHRRGTVCTLLN